MELPIDYQGIWKQFAEARHNVIDANQKLFRARGVILQLKSEVRVELMQQAFKRFETDLVLDVLSRMQVTEVQQFLTELLSVACYQSGLSEKALIIILSLPHDWILNNIEKYAQPLLDTNSYEEYEGLLYLYALLDRDLVMRLIRWGLLHSDSDIRQTATDFLRKFSDTVHGHEKD